MPAIRNKFSQKQKKILKKSIKILKSVPESMFDMSILHHEGDSNKRHPNTISTALRHLVPLLTRKQFKKVLNKKNHISYIKVTKKLFPELTADEWDFLFDTEWKDFDNTVNGAIRRIKFLLKRKYLSSQIMVNEDSVDFYMS